MPLNKQKNLSSPSTTPQYAPGTVAAIKPQNTIADYKKRLDKSYKTSIKAKVPKVDPNTGIITAANNEYQALMNKYKGDLAQQRNAAAQLFNKNKGALEAGRNSTREAITKQRGEGLDDIAQSYAARGIGRSSGVYQQAGTDYDTNINERLKNTDKTYEEQLKNAADSEKETIGAADTEYQEGLAEAAARKAAALEETKAAAAPTTGGAKKPAPKPTPKPRGLPVAKKPPVKYKLVNGR